MTDSDAPNTATTAQQQLQEALQEQYLQPLDELEVGQLVEGTVIQTGSETTFIDIGYKSEGRVPTEEFDEPPKVGDIVEVVLINKETLGGGVVVSKSKADEKRFWKVLKDAFTDRTPVDGTIAKSIKGGFEIDLGHKIRAFNPISKIDVRRVDNPEEYVGLKTKFYVERIYSESRVNIVLSRRSYLEEEAAKHKKEFFEHVEIADVVEGTVKSFTSFGAFVDLGGFDGLLHINDMSWGHVNRPKDYVKRGQVLQLKVIRMDPETQKINLSLKHLTEDPWNHFEAKYSVDQVVKGKVTKLTDFGAFIEVEEGIEGLAHISELSWVQRVSHPKEILKIGDEVEAKILDFDVPAGRVSLGLKQVLPNPWDTITNKFPEGLRVTRKVKKLTNAGAFIELEEGIDGFLHVDDLSWTTKYKNPGAVLTEGEEVECIVIQTDPEHHNIRLGVKQLSEDPWESLRKAYPERSIIDGEVTNITDFGVFVRVQGGVEGLINKAQLADPNDATFEQAVAKIKIGDKIRAVVTELNTTRQRLSLSVRELSRQEQRQEMQKYIGDEDASTFTLGDMLRDREND
ncbi:MAG: 30S ribosomal protein S1 [Spirochaetaceae bacterium]|nr:MAG: 30S ribosomal protein S1 [Spirochaetaceae bacterium]